MVSLPPLSLPCTLKLSEQHHLHPDPQAKPLESPLPCPSRPPPGQSITHSCLPNSPIHYHLPSSLLSPEPSKSPHKALPASRSPPSNPPAYFSSCHQRHLYTKHTHLVRFCSCFKSFSGPLTVPRAKSECPSRAKQKPPS